MPDKSNQDRKRDALLGGVYALLLILSFLSAASGVAARLGGSTSTGEQLLGLSLAFCCTAMVTMLAGRILRFGLRAGVLDFLGADPDGRIRNPWVMITVGLAVVTIAIAAR